MKKYIIILFATLIAGTSCTEWLDVKPRGYDIPTTIGQYEGMLYGKELYFMDEVFEYMSFEFTSDADGYKNAWSAMGRAQCNAYKWQKDVFLPDENCGEWNVPTSFLYPLNVIIAEVMNAEGATEEKKAAIRAEARMMRAWHHFLMAQFFAPPYNSAIASSSKCIPIITTASTVGAGFPLKTMEEVYDFILTEMEESVELLPEEAEHHLRVFKATGYAMLGKVLWMMGHYQEALPYLETAFTSAKAQRATLLDYNARIKEDGTIDLPSDRTEQPEYLYLMATMSRLMPAVYITYYNQAIFPIKEEVLFNYYKKNDTRLAFLSGVKSGKTAYASFKPGDQYAANIYGMVSNVGISVPDLYLMYAECLARQKRESEASEVLLQLRRNRMAAADADNIEADLLTAIISERIREYIGFGNLWFDMRRLWNDSDFQYLKDYYTHTDGETTYTLTEDRLYLEIPPIILSWHPEYNN